MVQRIRLFLVVEVLIFVVAALTHFEVLFDGYFDREAGVAESVIAVVLLGGLVLSWIRPAWTRKAGIAVQGFGLLGTLVGLFLLVVVGPQTALDVVYHAGMVVVLTWGLVFAIRSVRVDASQDQ